MLIVPRRGAAPLCNRPEACWTTRAEAWVSTGADHGGVRQASETHRSCSTPLRRRRQGAGIVDADLMMPTESTLRGGQPGVLRGVPTED
jgi:hypothetical protein